MTRGDSTSVRQKADFQIMFPSVPEDYGKPKGMQSFTVLLNDCAEQLSATLGTYV